MNEIFNISDCSGKPVYKQLVSSIEKAIRSDTLQAGLQLPSLNSLARQLDISKETVKKTYGILTDRGLIEPRQGKGYFVANHTDSANSRILLLFDKLSSYKQLLFDAFTHTMGDKAKIVIRIYNQDPSLLKFYLDESLDSFDYYVLSPHFPLDASSQNMAIKQIKRIPYRKLIMVDNWMRAVLGNYGAVYQDFENDIASGLASALDKIKTYPRLNVFTLPSSLYSKIIAKGIERFGDENGIKIRFIDEIKPEMIKANELFLSINSQFDVALIDLIRTARYNHLEIGRDIGLISFNEDPTSEIILNGLTTVSTDFAEMGRITANMILDGKMSKIHCPFRMTRRSSF